MPDVFVVIAVREPAGRESSYVAGVFASEHEAKARAAQQIELTKRRGKAFDEWCDQRWAVLGESASLDDRMAEHEVQSTQLIEKFKPKDGFVDRVRILRMPMGVWDQYIVVMGETGGA